MYKKISALIAALMLLCNMGTVVAAAEKTNLIANGGFEYVNTDGSAMQWSSADGLILVSKEQVREGDWSLRIKTDDGNLNTSQHVPYIVGKSDYTVSGSVFVVKGSIAKPVIKLEYYGEADGVLKNVGEERIDIDGTENQWSDFSYKVMAPKNATAVSILVRCLGNGAGDMYFDNLGFYGKPAEGYKPVELTHPEKKYEGPLQPEITYDEKTAKEFVKNGSFETVDEKTGALVNWNLQNGALGKEYILETESAPEGKNYLSIKTNETGDFYASQGLYGLVGLAEYKISMDLKIDNLPANKYPTIKFEMYGASGYTGEKSITRPPVKTGDGWGRWEFTLVTPEGTNMVSIMCRILAKEGEVSFDRVSVKGPHATDFPTAVDASKFPPVISKEPVEGGEERLINLSFEETNPDGSAKGYEVYGGWSGEYVKVQSKVARTGKNAIEISIDGSGYPWARQEILNITPGAEYQMSSWIRTSFQSGKGYAYKFEWYDKDGKGVAVGQIQYEIGEYYPQVTGENWYNVVNQIIAPEGAASLKVYLRLYGVGTIYVDDVSFYQTGMAPYCTVEVDDYFYYTEEEGGFATLTPDYKTYPNLGDIYAGFRILDGETVIREVTGVPVEDGRAIFKYYSEEFAKKQSPYVIEGTLYKADGTALETERQTVYRYDRPTVLDEHGNYIINGEVFYPMFGYHVSAKFYPRMKEIGVNVVQAKPTKQVLDAAKEHGVYVLAVLYDNMEAAGSAQNIERTKERVAEFKDHPALFAWAIMDEPYVFSTNPTPDLVSSYVTIRDIDPVHPVYVMEDGYNYQETSKCCDILGTDPYPGGLRNAPTFVAEQGMVARNVTQGKKPVYNLLQLFFYLDWYPSDDELRTMMYEVFLAGGTSIGFYEIDQTLASKPIFDVENSYKVLKDWTDKERQDAFDFFVNKKYPVFNEVKTEDYWEISFPKDGKLRVIIINHHEDKEINVNLPLVSTDGTVKIGNYTAKVYAGASEKNFTGTDALNVTIQKAGAVVYEITPSEAVDFSGLPVTRFTDLETHTWAAAAIEHLEEKGIVYGYTPQFFGPGEKITRGEFASFLVRALGLAAVECAEPFSDVSAYATYASDIAAGKAAGILNGVGDNKFSPDRLITRQDMMTMVARGMALRGEVDMSAYPDAGLFADYALPHAKAMIESGLIKGNADGTLNPLGFTTRAEAAVLMQRIVDIG